MSWMVALAATLALAVPPETPRDAAGWRAQSDALYAQGDHAAALDAALRALELDRRDPWSRYAWVRALAAVDPNAARAALPGLQDPAAIKAMAVEERARLDLATGYLCLDLGAESLATVHFQSVPPATASHHQAQAGLAILAVRRGLAQQALVYFVQARVSGRLEPPLAELEREARFQVVLREFTTARDLRDANAAGKAYSTLDELRPNHPATLRARADLAQLRGDEPARERALRDLLAVDRDAPGAASELVDSLLAQNRPRDALVAARDLAPERLAGDLRLQAIERNWVAHVDAALGGRWRDGQLRHDQLELPQFSIGWSANRPGVGQFRIAVDGAGPHAGHVPAGEPFGASPMLAAPAPAQQEAGAAASVQWAPRTGLLLELGHTPSSYEVSNLTGAVRLRFDTAGGPWSLGLERQAVADSLLSLAGVIDPVTGRRWGGVARNRAYLAASLGDEARNFFGSVSGSLLTGRGVDDNTQWAGEAGYWQRAASGNGWQASLGGSVRAEAYEDNRSRYTLGHGGYFSPRKLLTVGPTFDLRGRREATSFRFEGGVAWQVVREESSEYFPSDPALQAASGDPHYASDSREGVGGRIAATVEWRMSNRAVAGVRLEGLRGEDFDELRLQFYTRRWEGAITEPLREPAARLAPADSSQMF